MVSRYNERGYGSGGRVSAVYETIKKIHEKSSDGDILIFMAGQDEIDELADTLEENRHKLFDGPRMNKLIVLRAYAALPMHLLSEIFAPTPPGSRKVVIATNIAESSITVDGVKYVIDCGIVKENRFVILLLDLSQFRLFLWIS